MRATPTKTLARLGRGGAILAFVLATLTVLTGCGDSTTDTPDDDPTYAEIVATAWARFTAASYGAAEAGFQAAVTKDPAPAEGWSGLGWSRMKMDDLTGADAAFTTGATATGPDAVLADVWAGWAFLANATKATGTAGAGYDDSNVRADSALARSPAWSFAHLPALDADDLVVLKAANWFAMGEFDSSLVQVVTVDSTFSADVSTPAGRSSLAERIEALRDSGA